MIKQEIFNYNLKNLDNVQNFYVNSTNLDAYDGTLNEINNCIFLMGPKKSGKTFLGNIWIKKYNGLLYNNNFEDIINNKYNILIDSIDSKTDQEKLFHIVNHCKLQNLRVLILSQFSIDDLKFSLKDLNSRLKEYMYYKINIPDDDMLLKILTKLFIDKQFIINSQKVFEFIIKRANRSYEEIFNIVQKLDKLSLQKKRQLTIPLIKEIL